MRLAEDRSARVGAVRRRVAEFGGVVTVLSRAAASLNGPTPTRTRPRTPCTCARTRCTRPDTSRTRPRTPCTRPGSPCSWRVTRRTRAGARCTRTAALCTWRGTERSWKVTECWRLGTGRRRPRTLCRSAYRRCSRAGIQSDRPSQELKPPAQRFVSVNRRLRRPLADPSVRCARIIQTF